MYYTSVCWDAKFSYKEFKTAEIHLLDRTKIFQERSEKVNLLCQLLLSILFALRECPLMSSNFSGWGGGLKCPK